MEVDKQQVTQEYNHAEAFCLMWYQDEVTGEVEILWNSRDGVTPFIIQSRRGNDAVHINWQSDVRCSNFKPSLGMRIFVDATSELVKKDAQKYVNKYWEKEVFGNTMKKTLTNSQGAQMTKGEAVDFFIAEWTKPGSPYVQEVK